MTSWSLSKAVFGGKSYDHACPPSRHLKIAPICEQFVDFINGELIQRLKAGAISYLGQVGEVDPPYLISPITVEPSKPRLCLNLMYFNCFMKDTPFSLDTLHVADVQHLVKNGSYMSKLDDSSGYHHIFMSESSTPLLLFLRFWMEKRGICLSHNKLKSNAIFETAFHYWIVIFR